MIRLVASIFFAAAAAIAGADTASAMTIEKIVSPAGIEAWLVREKALPLVTLNYAFHGGTTQDEPKRPVPPILPPTCWTKGPAILTARPSMSAWKIMPSNSASRWAATTSTALCGH